jgi:hypothetical protein
MQALAKKKMAALANGNLDAVMAGLAAARPAPEGGSCPSKWRRPFVAAR